ncbi:hypothetical protein ElyMa_005246200 [Elysia marginata]|uniref:Uncharacterized protein n=1 Tax=Elysia marginata TaxID=1093978 RepID=A0AAV4K1Y3_9GAST|nr:hypothetical protein ElyMa_005246200 [Elysia marginata]
MIRHMLLADLRKWPFIDWNFLSILQPGSPGHCQPQDFDHSTDSDRAIRWVEKEFKKIREHYETDSDTGTKSNQRGSDDTLAKLPQEKQSSPSRDHNCVTANSADHKQAWQPPHTKSEHGMQAINDDFEFLEYYIDDDLNKLDQVQGMSPGASQAVETVPGILNKDFKLCPTDQSITSTSKSILNEQPNLDLSKKASFRDSAVPTSKNLEHRPPLFPRTKSIENTCQSALSKNTEFEDIRQKILSRRSASDKDLSASKGINLIARSQGGAKSRERVPVKPGGTKQSFMSDGLRSGASDPSLSVSFLRDKKTDTSLIETYAADDTNPEEENTLATASQSLDEMAPGVVSCLSEEPNVKMNRKEALCTSKRIVRKEKASQAELDTVEVRKYEIQDSDSIESDQWVKAKLGTIQKKIQRRKARPEYIISSDEDDGNGFLNLPLAPVSSTKQNGKHSHYLSKNIPTPNRCRSLIDIGIHMNENYSKVMEELKVSCRERRSQINALSEWTRGQGSEMDVIKREVIPKQPTFITASCTNLGGSQGTSSKIQQNEDAQPSSSKSSHRKSDKRVVKSPKNPAEMGLSSDPCNKKSKSQLGKPSTLIKDDTQSDYGRTSISHHSCKSLQVVAGEELSRDKNKRRSTESWLQDQNMQKSLIKGFQNGSQAKEESNIHSKGKSLARSSQYSMTSGSVRGGTHGSSSKQSIVSFSQVAGLDKRSDSSTHSLRSGQPHKHDGESKKSHLATRTHARGKRASKSRLLSNSSRLTCGETLPPALAQADQRGATATGTDEHQLTIGLEHARDREKTCQKLDQRKQDIFGMHRFFIPRESWPDGCHAKLNVEVHKNSQRVTTTATNPASGHTETLLDQVVVASKLKSTICME